MKMSSLSLILFLFFGSQSFANSFWNRLGPKGDFVLVRKVPNKSIVMAFTNANEYYRSTNNGFDWAFLNSSISLDYNEQNNDFRFNNGNIYLINNKIYKSTDDGESWTSIFSGNEIIDYQDHNSKGEILIKDQNNFFYSTNNGDSWIFLDMPSLNADNFTVIKARIDDSSRIHLFIQYWQNGFSSRVLIHSEDYGDTWEGALWDYPINVFFDFDLSDNGTRYILTLNELGGNSILIWETTDFWWEERYNSQQELGKVFADDSCAYVLEKYDQTNAYKLIRTLDNGSNWSMVLDTLYKDDFDYLYDDNILINNKFNPEISLDKGNNYYELNEAPLNTFSFFVNGFNVYKREPIENKSLILALNSNSWSEYLRYTDFIIKNNKLTFGQYQYIGDDEFEGKGYWILDPDIKNYPISDIDSNYIITNQFLINGNLYLALNKFNSYTNPYIYQATDNKVFSINISEISSNIIENVVDEMTTKMDPSGNVVIVAIKGAQSSYITPYLYVSNSPPPFDSSSGGNLQSNDTWWYSDLFKNKYNYSIVGLDTVYNKCYNCSNQNPTNIKWNNKNYIRIKNGNESELLINPMTNEPVEIDPVDIIIAAEEPNSDRFFFYDNVTGFGSNIFEIINNEFTRLIELKTDDNWNFGSPRAMDVLDGRLFVATTNGYYASSDKVNLPKLELTVSGGNISVSSGDTVKFKITVSSTSGSIPSDVELKVFNTIDSNETSISIDGNGKADYIYIVDELQEHGDFDFSFYASSPTHQYLEPIPKYVNVSDFSSDRYYTYEAFGTIIRFDSGEGNKFINVNGSLQLGQQQEITINDFLKFDGIVIIDPIEHVFAANGVLYLQGSKIPGNPFTDNFVLIDGEFEFEFENPLQIKIPSRFKEAFENATKVFGTFLEINEFQFLFDEETNIFDALKFNAGINIPGINGSCENDDEPKMTMEGIALSTDGINLDAVSLSNVGLLPSVCISELSFIYDSEADSLYIIGDFSAPFIEQIIAEFGLLDGYVNAIALGVTVENPIPILGTPLGLKGLYGSINGLAQPPLIFGIGGTVASVQEGLFELDLFGEVEIPNKIIFDATGRLIQIPGEDSWQIIANIGGEFDVRSHISVYGSVDAITIGGSEYFISGSADLSYVWEPEESMSGSIEGNIKIPEVPDWHGNVVYDMVSSVVGLPYNLANASFAFENQRVGGSFSTQVPVFGTFEMYFTANLEQDFPECCELGLGAININEFINQATPPKNNTKDNNIQPILLKNPRFLNSSRQDTIPVSDDMRMLIVRIKSDSTFPISKLINPNGVEFIETNQDTTVAYNETPSDSLGFWLLKEPIEGDWIIEFINSSEADTIDVFAFYNESIRSIEISQNDQDITLSWDTTNASNTAEYKIYIDNDNSGYDGLYVGSSFENIGLKLVSLNEKLSSCQYYFYIIKDNNYMITRKYLDTLISFDKIDIQAPEGLFLSGASVIDSVVINWNQSTSQNIAGYILKHFMGNYNNTKDSIIAYISASDSKYTISVESMIGEYYYIQAYNDSGDVSCNSSLIEIEEVAPSIQIIPLQSGWNFISSYIEAESKKMDSIFMDMKDDILIVKNSFGQIYVPTYNINTIGDWNNHHGYQVYSLVKDSLIISGTPLSPENEMIFAQIGWNMFCYLRNSPMDASAALHSLVDRNNLLIAKNNEGKIFVPQYLINTIGNLIPGQAYQMYISGLDTLIYPSNSNSKQLTIIPDTLDSKLISRYQYTGVDMTLIVEATFENGTEIGIYDENDILIGSGTFIDGKTGLTIWGDNEYTNLKDGAIIGEILEAKVLYDDQLLEQELLISNILDNEPMNQLKFRSNAIIFAQINVQKEMMEVRVSPQPVNDLLQLEMPIGEKSIEIRDIKGKLMLKLNSNQSTENINVSDFLNATYFITITTRERVFNIKFVKLK